MLASSEFCPSNRGLAYQLVTFLKYQEPSQKWHLVLYSLITDGSIKTYRLFQ